MRAGVREVLPQDFVKFARAKGLSPARVVLGHVLLDWRRILLRSRAVAGC